MPRSKRCCANCFWHQLCRDAYQARVSVRARVLRSELRERLLLSRNVENWIVTVDFAAFTSAAGKWTLNKGSARGPGSGSRENRNTAADKRVCLHPAYLKGHTRWVCFWEVLSPPGLQSSSLSRGIRSAHFSYLNFKWSSCVKSNFPLKHSYLPHASNFLLDRSFICACGKNQRRCTTPWRGETVIFQVVVCSLFTLLYRADSRTHTKTLLLQSQTQTFLAFLTSQCWTFCIDTRTRHKKKGQFKLILVDTIGCWCHFPLCDITKSDDLQNCDFSAKFNLFNWFHPSRNAYL